MCAGLMVLYNIPKVIMGENKTFPGPEDYLLTHGVELINLNLIECKQMIEDYIQNNPEIWNEEIDRVT
jgi:cytosine deaminase